MSTEVKPTDWDAEDNRWEPTPSGGGSGLPSYTSADKGKVLTVEEGSETVQTVIVPEQSVTVTDSAVELSNADIDVFTDGAGTFSINGTDYTYDNLIEDGYATVMLDSVAYSIYLDTGKLYFSADTLSFPATKVPGTYSISLSRSVSSVEPKWEAALPDYSNAAEGAVLTIVNGVPTWSTT